METNGSTTPTPILEPPTRTPAKAGEGIFYVSVLSGLFGLLTLFGAGLMFLGQYNAEGDDAAFTARYYVLAAGLFFTVLSLGLQAGNIWDGIRQRRSMVAANVALMCLLAAALLGLVNAVAFRYHAQWDWTSEGFYSISDETVKVVEGLAKDVEVTIILPASQQTDVDVVRRLLEQYSQRTTRMKVHNVDPSVDRQAADRVIRNLGLVGRDYMDLLGVAVQAGSYDAGGTFKADKMKHVALAEFYEQDVRAQLGNTNTGRVFRGEQMITSALLEVTEEAKAKLYFLEGHQEMELEGMKNGQEHAIGALVKLLRQKNYEVAGLKLLEREKADIPDDASALVIAGPQRTIAAAELAAIEKYLATGGHLLAMIDPVRQRRPGSDESTYVDLGIEQLLKKYNIDAPRRTVVTFERLPGTQYIQPTLNVYGSNFDTQSPITKPLRGERAVFLEARPLKALSTASNVKATEILRSPEQYATTAFPDPFFETGKLPDDAQKGAVTLAVTAEQELDAAPDAPGEKKDDKAPAKPKKVARLVVFGDSDFASNGVLEADRNLELITNSLTWLVGQKRFVSQAKRPHSYKLDLGKGNIILFQLLAFPGLPSFAIILGVLVWILRRRG